MIKMVLGDAKPKVCVTSAALADRLPDDQPAIVMSKGWESREVRGAARRSERAPRRPT